MSSRLLTLIRHAKSSWEHTGLSDKQRPLAHKGKQDAYLIGLHNKNLLSTIDCFYCSSAHRTKQTLTTLFDAADINHGQQKYHDNLYTFDCNNLLQQTVLFDDNFKHIAIIGHNPALNDLINHCTDDTLNHLSTSTLVTIKLSIDSWQQLNAFNELVALSPKPLGKILYLATSKLYSLCK